MTHERPGMVDVDDGLLAQWPLPRPDAAADKEVRGSLLVVAGSREMPGAAWLAAVSGLRAGAGKLIVATAASVAAGLALKLPEARVIALGETGAGGLAASGIEAIGPVLACADAIVVGPGLQDEGGTREFVGRLIECRSDAALVLDALAMSIVLDGRRLERMPLLTPHAGELAHLSGIAKSEIVAQPEHAARTSAARWNACVVLKGATTVIAHPDGRMWRHCGGNAGLATSGSGDTLAGIAGGLATRGASLEQAAAWAVVLHARAGDAMALRCAPLGYLASELPAEVPRLMHVLGQHRRSPA